MRWPPFIWTGAAALILSLQVFCRPIIGLADNNDFPKITGRLPLCPEDPLHYKKYLFVNRTWVVSQVCEWESGLPSTELELARTALTISRGMHHAVFDIRLPGLDPRAVASRRPGRSLLLEPVMGSQSSRHNRIHRCRLCLFVELVLHGYCLRVVSLVRGGVFPVGLSNREYRLSRHLPSIRGMPDCLQNPT